jgi:outer membrane autotransporter protein
MKALNAITTVAILMMGVDAAKDWGSGTIGTTVALGQGVTAYASFTDQFGQSQANFYSGQLGLNVALGAPTAPIAAKY